MMSSPLKLVVAALVVGAIASTVLAMKFEESSAAVAAQGGSQGAGAATPASQSLFERWFGGMEFRTPQDEQRNPLNSPQRPGAAPQQQGAAPQQQSLHAMAPRAASGFGSVALNADGAGHYTAQVEIEGHTTPMLVDTGASIVALRHEDAMSLGLQAAPSDYTARMSTANGEIFAARKRLREVRIENITVTDVDAVIMPQGALSHSLLGMSFLKKLASFEVASGQLVLKP